MFNLKLTNFDPMTGEVIADIEYLFQRYENEKRIYVKKSAAYTKDDIQYYTFAEGKKLFDKLTGETYPDMGDLMVVQGDADIFFLEKLPVLTIGKYEDNMFIFNSNYDHDFLDNPDFVESLDERFIHNDTGLYFSGTEEEYHTVIDKSIIEFNSDNG